jgi:diketogulonate reductase-like aldo/keto reductase
MAQPERVEPHALPPLMYGTAWKEERTEALVAEALAAGFRAIDTANQRKHYVEAGVGAALRTSAVPREQLFLQTKFTYARGQDHRLPYDPHASLTTQVEQSFASSLEHLSVLRLDSYVLHGPWSSQGWSPQDRETWAAMEALCHAGQVRFLGISNVSLAQLEALCEVEALTPSFVQNRCYARTGWDRAVRAFCRQRAIVYQGFSLLTANGRELQSPAVHAVAKRVGATVAQLVFSFARASGMLSLTGTSDPAHMREDLASAQFTLSPDDLSTLERLDDP